MLTVTINWQRAEQVFGIILEALKNEEYPYNIAKPPQRKENLPQSLTWGSHEHALFLFCACYYMRGGIESDTAIISLSRMYVNHRKFFLPWTFQNEELNNFWYKEIYEALTSHGLNFNAEQIKRHWVLNFQKLWKFWDSNPSKLFEGAQTFEVLCERIMHIRQKSRAPQAFGFFGFQEKMVSMLIHFFMDAGIVSPFIFPVPVDFHVLRVCVAHELITVNAQQGTDLYTPEVRAAARELSSTYCKKHAVDPLRLGDALWLLSRTLCPEHPGNQTQVGKRNGRKTLLTPEPITWNEAQTAAYHRSCGRCPVAHTCVSNVPSGEYYIAGKLVVRGPRERPSQLFSLEPEPSVS